jgi:hypothetical protein
MPSDSGTAVDILPSRARDDALAWDAAACYHRERTAIMVDPTIDPLGYERLQRLETAVAHLRYIVIAVMVVMIAGFSLLGVKIGQLDGRIDRLTAKVDGTDATLAVKFDETNAKLDAISQRLAVEFKTMGAEIATRTNAIAKSIAPAGGVAPAPPPSAPAQPAPAPAQPKPAPGQPPRGQR